MLDKEKWKNILVWIRTYLYFKRALCVNVDIQLVIRDEDDRHLILWEVNIVRRLTMTLSETLYIRCSIISHSSQSEKVCFKCLHFRLPLCLWHTSVWEVADFKDTYREGHTSYLIGNHCIWRRINYCILIFNVCKWRLVTSDFTENHVLFGSREILNINSLSSQHRMCRLP